jgi:hypothetical protein
MSRPEELNERSKHRESGLGHDSQGKGSFGPFARAPMAAANGVGVGVARINAWGAVAACGRSFR